MENERKAAVTDKVPSAESLRPVNGNESGPRWHCALMFTRDTWLTVSSINAEISFTSGDIYSENSFHNDSDDLFDSDILKINSDFYQKMIFWQ